MAISIRQYLAHSADIIMERMIDQSKNKKHVKLSKTRL